MTCDAVWCYVSSWINTSLNGFVQSERWWELCFAVEGVSSPEERIVPCILTVCCICFLNFLISNNVLCVCLLQGEEGPPSLEYIQARDLFPQKDLVKEDDTLQVSFTHGSEDADVCWLVTMRHKLFFCLQGKYCRWQSWILCCVPFKSRNIYYLVGH